jgi:hypothetical protein
MAEEQQPALEPAQLLGRAKNQQFIAFKKRSSPPGLTIWSPFRRIPATRTPLS